MLTYTADPVLLLRHSERKSMAIGITRLHPTNTGFSKSQNSQYQTVYFELFNREFHFQPYESIFLERSCKYSMHDIKNLAHRSGFEVDDFYEDSKGWFVNAFFKKNKES